MGYRPEELDDDFESISRIETTISINVPGENGQIFKPGVTTGDRDRFAGFRSLLKPAQ